MVFVILIITLIVGFILQIIKCAFNSNDNTPDEEYLDNSEWMNCKTKDRTEIQATKDANYEWFNYKNL